MSALSVLFDINQKKNYDKSIIIENSIIDTPKHNLIDYLLNISRDILSIKKGEELFKGGSKNKIRKYNKHFKINN